MATKQIIDPVLIEYIFCSYGLTPIFNNTAAIITLNIEDIGSDIGYYILFHLNLLLQKFRENNKKDGVRLIDIIIHKWRTVGSSEIVIEFLPIIFGHNSNKH